MISDSVQSIGGIRGQFNGAARAHPPTHGPAALAVCGGAARRGARTPSRAAGVTARGGTEAILA